MSNLANKVYQILRWSESYFKADMIYLAKGNFWQITNQVATGISTLGLTVLFANILSQETYGLYRYILSLAGVLNIFTLTGMNRAIVQGVASGNEGAFKTSVKYQLKWNVMQFAAFCALSAYYFFNGNPEIGISIFTIGLLSPLTLAFNTYGAYLEGKKEFKLNNLFSTLSTFIYVGGMALAILISDKIAWLILIYSLTTFLSTTIFYIVTIKKFKPPTSPADDVLKYSKELTLIGAMGPIVGQIDKIILSHFWGASQLAVYSLASAVPERATTLIKGWVAIGLPKFSNKTPEEINTVFYTRILQGLGIGALCFAGYYLLAPYLFTYLLPKYLDGIFYSQILAISFLFALPNRYIGLLLISQKMSKVMFTSNFIQNVIRVILYIIFGVTSGILGLVLVHVVMSGVGVLINIGAWRLFSYRNSSI